MTHPPGCGCTAYACELRAKAVGYAMKATPTVRARRPWRPRVNASWEAGVAGERRSGGTFMPYVGENTYRRIPIKEAAERRREISEVRHRQHAGASSQE